MRVLITGGAGFIGSNLTAKLLDRGSKVQIIDNLHPQVHGQNPDLSFTKHVEFIHGDIRNSELLLEKVKEFMPEIVFHLAAETGTGQSFDELERYNSTNIMGTVNVLNAILNSKKASVQKIVIPSSRSIYGEGDWFNNAGIAVAAESRKQRDLEDGIFNPRDDKGEVLTAPTPNSIVTKLNPVSIYASTKLMQEYLVRQVCEKHGISHSICRLQNVFGPGQSLRNPYTGVLSIFCSQILEDKVLNIYEDGEIVRDFVDVSDVTDALFAASNSQKNLTVDVGNGKPQTILSTAKMMLKIAGKDPDEHLKITGQFRHGDIRSGFADITRAKSQLNWEPKINVETSLENLFNWARHNPNGI